MPKRGKKGEKTAIRHSEVFLRSCATVNLRLSCGAAFPSFCVALLATSPEESLLFLRAGEELFSESVLPLSRSP